MQGLLSYLYLYYFTSKLHGMDKIKSKLSTLENPVSYTLKMFIPGLKDHSIAILDL